MRHDQTQPLAIAERAWCATKNQSGRKLQQAAAAEFDTACPLSVGSEFGDDDPLDWQFTENDVHTALGEALTISMCRSRKRW